MLWQDLQKCSIAEHCLGSMLELTKRNLKFMKGQYMKPIRVLIKSTYESLFKSYSNLWIYIIIVLYDYLGKKRVMLQGVSRIMHLLWTGF